jgi:hypothetical protein
MLGFLRAPPPPTTHLSDRRRTAASSSSSSTPRKKHKPSLFDAFQREQRQREERAAAPPAVAAVSHQIITGELPPHRDDDNDDSAAAAAAAVAAGRGVTYVGFSVTKIRHELFQSWLTDQPDFSQYRAADLVAAGAVDAVFQELVRVACLCTARRPQLLLEVARVRSGLRAEFAGRYRDQLAARAAQPGFGRSANGSSSSSSMTVMFSGDSKKKKRGNNNKKKKQTSSALLAGITGRPSAQRNGGGDAVPWIRFRNDAALRRPIARLVLLAYLAVDDAALAAAAYTPPPFVSQDEYVAERLRQRLRADRADYAHAVLRKDDPIEKVQVAANELVFFLVTPAPTAAEAVTARLNAVCYWLQWLAQRRGVVCAEREQFGGTKAAATRPVCIAWDAMYYAARSRPEPRYLMPVLDLLSTEFCGVGSGGSGGAPRMYLLYCAARLVLFGADWTAPLFRADAEEDIARRVELDADLAYRVLQMEKAKVDADLHQQQEER